MERLHRIATGFIEAKLLLVAAEMRLFDALGDAGATVEEVAERSGATLRGIEIVLDALTAMEILVKREGRYALVEEYAPHLREGSPSQLPSLLRHRNRMFRTWALLEERIRGEHDHPQFERAFLLDASSNDDFIRAMAAVGRDRAKQIVDRVPLEGVRVVADIGGGPGHYLEEMATRSEGIEPYLVDLPATLATARRVLAGRPGAARIRMVEWDVYAGPAPATLPVLDLAFVSQVVHGESPERNRQFLGRLAKRIGPGGALVIHECTVGPERTSPREAALFAVNMLAMTPGGRSYTEEEITSWCRSTGFEPEGVERIDERSCLLRYRRIGEPS